MTKKFGAGILAGGIGTIFVGIAVSLIFVYAGAYNIAATDPHADVVR